jgi:hypothetical protein
MHYRAWRLPSSDKIVSLTPSTAPSVITPNDTSDGFKLVTIATTAPHTYRITRQTTNTSGIVKLDKLDFSLNTDSLTPGTPLVLNIPYTPTLFVNIFEESQPHSLETLDSDVRTPFQGEIFKLLRIGVSPNDPTRENPSVILLGKKYTVSGPKEMSFIYYTLLNGSPVHASCMGNVAFDESETVPINPDKLVDVYETSSTIYCIIRVTTTPNLVVTDGIPSEVQPVVDKYVEDGIEYSMSAIGDSLVNNSFFVQLTIPAGVSVNKGFDVEPKDSIEKYVVTKLSETVYKFDITAQVGVKNLNIRITITK